MSAVSSSRLKLLAEDTFKPEMLDEEVLPLLGIAVAGLGGLSDSRRDPPKEVPGRLVLAFMRSAFPCGGLSGRW